MIYKQKASSILQASVRSSFGSVSPGLMHKTNKTSPSVGDHCHSAG